jgi:hypothetical protein
MIWCTSISIPSFAAVVLWLGVASSDSFVDPAYCGLHNLVRGLHGDRTLLQLVELLHPRSALVRPRHGAKGAGLRRCLCPPKARCQPVLLPLSIQPAVQVALLMERHHRATLGGYRSAPCWGYGVAKKDLHKLQLVLDVLKSLIRGGLTGVDHLRTFVSRHIQPLQRWEMTM